MHNEQKILSKELSEENLINIIREGYFRHPDQINDVFTSDAEILDIGTDELLVCTTDTLNEEIQLGILENPWKIGWTAVNINLSDLAAVGAKPSGILLSWNIPESLTKKYLKEVSNGISSAVNYHKTYIIGGDVNSAKQFQITGTAIGFVRRDRCMQRTGVQAGDFIFMTGPIGLGNALGFAKLKSLPESKELEYLYKPTARCAESYIISKYATACIDTSDGVFASLDIISRLNQCGIIYKNYPLNYHNRVRELSVKYNLSKWLFAAAEHGEFELLFTIPPHLKEQCIRECLNNNIQLIEIGKLTSELGIMLENEDKSLTGIDTGYIKEITKLIRDNPADYMTAMLEYSDKVNAD